MEKQNLRNCRKFVPLWTILVSALLLCGTGCERQTQTAPSMEDVRKEGEPVKESWDVRFLVSETVQGTETSRPRLQIDADYMAAFEQGDSTYTLMRGSDDSTKTRVTAYLYENLDTPSTTVTADRLIYFDEDRRFEASGNVIVETRENKRLETEDLFWYEVDRVVRTPGFTRIQTPTETIQGYRLVADENLDTYELEQISGQVTIEEEQ